MAAFLESRIPFVAIPEVIAAAMDAYDRSSRGPVRTLADVRRVDGWATEFASQRSGRVKSKL